MQIALRHRPVYFFLMSLLALSSCGDNKNREKAEVATARPIPEFNADSAYIFVERQVAFGARIPNTPAHRATGDYILRKLREYGARTVVQEFQATTFDGQKLNLRNLIGSFRPEVQKRIILAAHWDTRPFSDKDPNAPDKSFDGANDGASGVAVLLEVGRHLKEQPSVGVDLIFFDGEDWGEREGTKVPTTGGLDSWWCLGSQHWSKQKHAPGYRAYYGILLDMVGGSNAQFYQEGTSMMYAPKIVEKVWSQAARLGHGSTFVQQRQAPITDDHLFVNELGGIQMIDITEYDPNVGYFGPFHHTQKDNLQQISRETLGIVGRVVMQVIYLEE
ncbi:MAG: M28 family peptidase [Cyclobacteriaceae bacterium]|nr:M28 family peptidase [Cyclobacteriaceae bacterium]